MDGFHLCGCPQPGWYGAGVWPGSGHPCTTRQEPLARSIQDELPCHLSWNPELGAYLCKEAPSPQLHRPGGLQDSVCWEQRMLQGGLCGEILLPGEHPPPAMSQARPWCWVAALTGLAFWSGEDPMLLKACWKGRGSRKNRAGAGIGRRRAVASRRKLPALNTRASPALSQSRKCTRVTCHSTQPVPRTALSSAETVCEQALGPRTPPRTWTCGRDPSPGSTRGPHEEVLRGAALPPPTWSPSSSTSCLPAMLPAQSALDILEEGVLEARP
ncbi:uncharacterized protein LOC111169360 isoform X2 [Delphinapterus leucas]|uniref:Uncharacterized protein LOC111169360 isoform X2 n=1 Tax=Delphinapterus leucas TaxID=9749 RepID=A0A7F8K1Z3_DELLE|nr:uncharacterized protein LOC111169360 isoform X2 [Delphinapterus leucas]